MKKRSTRRLDRGPARERLRERYRPTRVRMLFVGESPPASGKFFYQADSGLYRAIRDAFLIAFPNLSDADFLESFREFGCYLVDLCGKPVDRLSPQERRAACVNGERRLAKIVEQLKPKIIVTVVRSVSANVSRAREQAGWRGPHRELPYPGRWHHHRVEFLKMLVPVLRRELTGEGMNWGAKVSGRAADRSNRQKIRRSSTN